MNWKFKIDLKDIWARAENEDNYDDVVFVKFRDEIVEVLRKREADFLGNAKVQFQNIVEYLAIAEDIEEFNGHFASLYDWSDDNAVWIATIF